MHALDQRSKMRMMLREGCLEGGHSADGDGKARCSGYVVKTFGRKMCFPCLELASHTTWTLLSLRNVLRYGLGIDPFGVSSTGLAACSQFGITRDRGGDGAIGGTTGKERGYGGILHTANRTLHGDPEDWILDEELADFVKSRTEGGIELDTVRRKRDVVLEIKLSTDSREVYRRRARGGRGGGSGRSHERGMDNGSVAPLALNDGPQELGSPGGIGGV